MELIAAAEKADEKLRERDLFAVVIMEARQRHRQHLRKHGCDWYYQDDADANGESENSDAVDAQTKTDSEFPKWKLDPLDWPGVAALPEDYGHAPATFQADEDNLLMGTHLRRFVGEERALLTKRFKLITELVPKISEEYEYADFMWGHRVMDSRAYGMKYRLPPKKGEKKKKGPKVKDSTLIPLMDLANHRRDPSCTWSYNHTLGAFTLDALRFIPAGQEITSPYGMKNNLHYLEAYGFRYDGYPVPEIAPGAYWWGWDFGTHSVF